MCLKKIILLKRNDNFVVSSRAKIKRGGFASSYSGITILQMKENITIKRTTSSNKDFGLLVAHLDNELWNELNEDQAQYDQYNKVPDLQTVVIVYVNEQPAACGCFKKYNGDTVEIKRMFVEKEYRGNGLSKIVLAELEEWAMEDKARNAILETSIHFTAAKTLYMNAGYKLIPNYDQYAGLTESVCMKKELNAIESPGFRQLNNIEYFDFEEDFVEEGIRCIPMIVRFKLDNAGIKLKLGEWAKFNGSEKLKLALLECNSEEEVKDYHSTVAALVKKYTGKEATALPVEKDPCWDNNSDVPAELFQKAIELGIKINAAEWKSLTALQRFALLKLCKPGHENRNFPIALKEFGLMK
jgi:hypothetical protein